MHKYTCIYIYAISSTYVFTFKVPQIQTQAMTQQKHITNQMYPVTEAEPCLQSVFQNKTILLLQLRTEGTPR